MDGCECQYCCYYYYYYHYSLEPRTCCPECNSTAFKSTPLGENGPPLHRSCVALQ